MNAGGATVLGLGGSEDADRVRRMEKQERYEERREMGREPGEERGRKRGEGPPFDLPTRTLFIGKRDDAERHDERDRERETEGETEGDTEGGT